LRGFITTMVEEDFCGGLHGDVFDCEFAAECLLVFADDAAAEVDERFGDVDFYRADFVARAAECGCVGK
jgi:hypothetical protein